MISTDGGELLKARDIPQLQRFIAADDFDWNGEEIQRATEQGPIDAWTMPRTIVALVRDEATGSLHVRHGARRKRVYFVDGRPEVVHSTDPRELLGEVLVASELCTRMEVEMAMAMLARYDDSLGVALVELGVLTEQQVQRCTHQQLKARIVELLRWRRGRYAITLGARNQRSERRVKLPEPPETLLAEGIRSCYHVAELEALLDGVREKVLVPVARPPLDLHAFQLPETALTVLEGVQGKTTLATILAQASTGGGADPEEVYQALFLGLSCDFIETAG